MGFLHDALPVAFLSPDKGIEIRVSDAYSPNQGYKKRHKNTYHPVAVVIVGNKHGYTDKPGGRNDTQVDKEILEKPFVGSNTNFGLPENMGRD